MKNLDNLIAKKFGRWTILKRSKNIHKEVYFFCKCDCGTKRKVKAASLRAGTSKSCGCLLKELVSKRNHIRNMYQKISPPGHTVFGSLKHLYKFCAKKRRILWTLTDDFFKNITKQDCHYCGKKPSQVSKPRSMKTRRGSSIRAYENGFYIYNGIDRIDSSKGYTEDNVVPCCSSCNYAKLNMTQHEFSNWILSVYSWAIKHLKDQSNPLHERAHIHEAHREDAAS
jgi:hypothetical protein